MSDDDIETEPKPSLALALLMILGQSVVAGFAARHGNWILAALAGWGALIWAFAVLWYVGSSGYTAGPHSSSEGRRARGSGSER